MGLNYPELILYSYKTLFDQELVPNKHELNTFSAVIACHNNAQDPVFQYGNARALEVFEMNFEDFTKLPSRFSAEPLERSEREKLLQEVSDKGYISNYSGVRISSTGKRFLIKNATVWNMLDATGEYKGQAVVFREFEYL